ncbi:Asp-tRNA(Asn)/Glu-tRNA(Gln) amidotransferase subunit GatC [Candidatus Woesearchaeota archaeon]|nr:Asp-tRNA(Asn)/Glu-tRNA(Gln) amidotransferase subunit GatC [Candidatus Woesearchaeota archaeon]
MKVDEKLVRSIAETARLKLSDSEVKKFTPELKEILSYFSKLDELDTSKVKLSLQPVEVRNVLREDKVEECFTQKKALSQTKHEKDGYFKGPKAI